MKPIFCMYVLDNFRIRSDYFSKELDQFPEETPNLSSGKFS